MLKCEILQKYFVKNYKMCRIIQILYFSAAFHHIIDIMWLREKEQRHFFYLIPVGFAAFLGIDAGGIYAGMAQNICQADDVFFHGIVHPGEQMAQIMGKNLLC